MLGRRPDGAALGGHGPARPAHACTCIRRLLPHRDHGDDPCEAHCPAKVTSARALAFPVPNRFQPAFSLNHPVNKYAATHRTPRTTPPQRHRTRPPPGPGSAVRKRDVPRSSEGPLWSPTSATAVAPPASCPLPCRQVYATPSTSGRLRFIDFCHRLIGAILGSGVGIASGGTAMAGTIPLAKTGAVIGGQGAVLAALALGIDCIGLAGLAADLAAQGSAATTNAAARAVNWLRNKLADHIGHTTEPVITAYDRYIAYDVAEWPHPRSHRTATAATLYPPPYSDPEDLLNFIRDQLQR